MTAHSLDLASLLCSRLCHDMLSPIGALNNGIELITEEKDPEMRKRCFELLELAFGAAGGYGDMVPVEEPRNVVDALAGNNGRIEVKWSFSGDSLPKPAVKVLLNLALIGIEALVRGGTLEIGAELKDGTSEIAVRAAGSRIAFDDTVGQALAGTLHPSELSSRTAPAAMIHQLAASMGGALQYALSEDALVLGAVLPGG
jgi:histidine phosphotransferase ChpT